MNEENNGSVISKIATEWPMWRKKLIRRAKCSYFNADGSRRENYYADLNSADAQQALLYVETLERELSAERDAVAQHIGERNGLREKLEQKELWILEYQRLNVIEFQILTARLRGEKHPKDNGFKYVGEVDIAALQAERDTLRTQLAQAQNEALEKAYRPTEVMKDAGGEVMLQFLEMGKDSGLTAGQWAEGVYMEMFRLLLKSPNSAEGEDDTHMYGGGSDPYSRR